MKSLLILSFFLASGFCRGDEPALKGYDPVAYFTEGKATPGEAGITLNFGGQVIRFSSARHRDMFSATPAKYAPQYGGHCAYGMSNGKRIDADPTAFSIVEGRLYLFSKPEFVTRFQRDWKRWILAADRYWSSAQK